MLYLIICLYNHVNKNSCLCGRLFLFFFKLVEFDGFNQLKGLNKSDVNEFISSSVGYRSLEKI